MSAQTGEDVPDGPVSTRAVDRARFRFDLLRRDPNPIWVRELKQSTRLVRTPFVLMALCILMTLVVAALGASMDSDGADEKIGTALYHVYFSLAFFVVAFAGPAIAANSIASEREGRTWEAVMLTGLKPELIARGKFLAALTSIATYLLMVAPVGALAFLFGGVSALEVVLAFVLLLGIGTLFVLLGLAISSQTQSMRVSLIATLFVTVPLSMFMFGAFGVIGSGFAHAVWPKVPSGYPIWVPAAYVRADFGAEYVLLLIAGPIVFLGLPGWFLYQTVVANLKDANDDQSSGLKRWFTVATPVISAYGCAAVAVVEPKNAMPIGLMSFFLLYAHLAFSVVVFSGEPGGPSRRVRAAWERVRASALTRFFGPSLAGASALQLAFGVVGVAVVTAASVWSASRIDIYGRTLPPEQLLALVAFVAFLFAFYVFMVGATAWLRARLSALVTRVLAVVLVVGFSVAPWVIAIVAQALWKNGDDSLIFASSSPFYSFLLASKVSRRDSGGSNAVAGYVTMGVWVVLGLVLARLAASHNARLAHAIDVQANETDRRLDAEDLARAAQAAGAFADAPPVEAAPADAPPAGTQRSDVPPADASPAEAAPPAAPESPEDPEVEEPA